MVRPLALLTLSPVIMAGVVELTSILFNYFSIPY